MEMPGAAWRSCAGLHRFAGWALALTLAAHGASAWAWGTEGHEIVGEIATHYLQPAVRAKVFAMLAADTDPLTGHGIVAETTWADRYRDSDRGTTRIHYNQTREWHFVDIELASGDLDAACFGHPPLPHGTFASSGPDSDCAVDKIDQFAAELHAASTPPNERLLALKFLLHLLGDMHQPLHASDDQDAGGNARQVSAAGLGDGTLHGFWDNQFVAQLGSDPVAVGDLLATKISAEEIALWSKGKPSDWALESFAVAKASVYGKLPRRGGNGVYALPASYVSASRPIVSTQLSRAGVRLATVLNQALGSSDAMSPANR